MRHFRFLQKKYALLAQTFLFASLILILVGLPFHLNSSLEIEREEAHAQWVVKDPLNLIQNSFTAAIQSSLQIKEFSLDGIAFALAQKAVQSMTQSLVQWINSGFQGSPAFVQNLELHLTYLADRIAGEFIGELSDGFLCSPFRLNVSGALALQYQSSRMGFHQSNQCTLSAIEANLEGFGEGGVANWATFFQVATVPSNNQYGAYSKAERELGLRITNAQGQEKTLLSFGDGFLSYRDLKAPECNVDGVHTPDKCPTITPGKVISEGLNKALGSGQDSLISADEINEIIGALFAQLTQQAITGANGLLGVSSGSNGGRSYLDQITDDTTSVGYDGAGFSQITTALQNEGQYLVTVEQIVSVVDSVDALDCSQPLPTALTTARTNAAREVTSTQANVTQLESLQTRITSATTDTARSALTTEYQSLISSGTLHTASEMNSLRTLLNTVSSNATEYQSRYCKSGL